MGIKESFNKPESQENIQGLPENFKELQGNQLEHILRNRISTMAGALARIEKARISSNKAREETWLNVFEENKSQVIEELEAFAQNTANLEKQSFVTNKDITTIKNLIVGLNLENPNTLAAIKKIETLLDTFIKNS